MPYLFAHFKEKETPDGEQVYFAISKDGYHFEQVNNGNPILEAKLGAKGCRDIEIVRVKDEFVIITTDLNIAYYAQEHGGNVDWIDINHNGSKCLRFWRSKDLISFSEEDVHDMGRDDFGCLWAPETLYDEENDRYLLHWSSTIKEDGYEHTAIYACLTKDFKTFSKPEEFFSKKDPIIDSHTVKIGDTYHLFYKNSHPGKNLHATSKNMFGPYVNDDSFQEYMESFDCPGSYEGPTTYVLPDGKWCMMLDFFGCPRNEMGYVPYVSSKPGDSNFERVDEKFSFPYGIKHGRCIEITEEEYSNIKQAYKNEE